MPLRRVRYAGRRTAQMLPAADDAARAAASIRLTCDVGLDAHRGGRPRAGRGSFAAWRAGARTRRSSSRVAGRRAVAKVPRPHLVDDPHCLLRLRNEGRALQRLAHPALPRHLGTVLSGPHPHLLLEHVPGPTLHAAVSRRRACPSPLVAALGAAIARALAHIAAAGWVHLDVKPSNIMLNVRPRLIDFELARPVADAARMTRPRGHVGVHAPRAAPSRCRRRTAGGRLRTRGLAPRGARRAAAHQARPSRTRRRFPGLSARC